VLPWTLVGTLVIVAALYDVRERRIPNGLTFGLMLAGLGYGAVTGGIAGAFDALAGLGTGFALLLPLYLLRATGAGDVKLAAAIGAWCGARTTVWVLCYAAIVGGALAVLWIAWRSFRAGTTRPWRELGLRLLAMFACPVASRAELKASVSRAKYSVPYAVPIAIGFWLQIFLSWGPAQPV